MSSHEHSERGHLDRYLGRRLQAWASHFPPPGDGKARLMEAVHRSSQSERKHRQIAYSALRIFYRFLSMLLFSIDWTISPSYLSQNEIHAEFQPASVYKQLAVTSLGYTFPLRIGFVRAAG